MDIQFFAQLVLATVASCAIVVPLAYLGVRGALRSQEQRLKNLELALDGTDARVSKMQKQRAADASSEVRQAARSVVEEAQDLLSKQQAPGRPSVIRRVK